MTESPRSTASVELSDTDTDTDADADIDMKKTSSQTTVNLIKNIQAIDKRKKILVQVKKIENKKENERKHKELVKKTMVDFYEFIDDKIKDACKKEETSTFLYINKSFICNKCYYDGYDPKTDYEHSCHSLKKIESFNVVDPLWFEPYFFIRRKLGEKYNALVNFSMPTIYYSDRSHLEDNIFNKHGHISNMSIIKNHIIKIDILWAEGNSSLYSKSLDFDLNHKHPYFSALFLKKILELIINNANEWDSCINLNENNCMFKPHIIDYHNNIAINGTLSNIYLNSEKLVKLFIDKFNIYCEYLKDHKYIFRWDKNSILKIDQIISEYEEKRKAEEEKRKAEEEVFEPPPCCLIM